MSEHLIEATDCPTCVLSASIGGILCVCGHDWTCHIGTPPLGEPCSHCACRNMQDRATGV